MKPSPIGRIAAAVVLITSVSACSADSGSEDANSFKFWSFTAINAQDGVDRYLAEHPDVSIELAEVGTSQETAQALTTALAGGDVPDLVLIQGDDMPKFLENPGNFYDLSEFGADEIKDDYLDWVMGQSTAEDGQIIGIPTDVGGMAMAYRTDLFEAAGLPTDRNAVAELWPTWEDYLKVAEQYTASTGKPFMDNASTTVFYQAVNQVDEKYYDNETREPIYADNPAVKEAFDLAVSAATTETTARLSSFSEGWSAGQANGAFATMSAPSWMLGGIKNNAPDTEGLWDVAAVPGVSGNWGGSYLAIPARAKNPEAAWEYIKQVQAPEGQLSNFLNSGSLPPAPSVYEDEELLARTDPFFSDAPIGKIYTESLIGLKPFYVGPDSSTIGAEFQNAIIAVENGEMSPDSAYQTAVDNIRTALGG